MKTTIENFIGVFEDAYSKEYCQTVIKYFEDMHEAGFTANRQEQGEKVLKTQKNDTQLYGHDESCVLYTKSVSKIFNEVFWKQAYPEYVKKFDVLSFAGPHTNYSFKIQKTCIGEGYHLWHFESDSRTNSNRILAWALYLNDVEEGGETEFLYYPKRISAKAGTLVLWPAGFAHAHRGNPPISNDKYIVTGWVEY